MKYCLLLFLLISFESIHTMEDYLTESDFPSHSPAINFLDQHIELVKTMLEQQGYDNNTIEKKLKKLRDKFLKSKDK